MCLIGLGGGCSPSADPPLPSVRALRAQEPTRREATTHRKGPSLTRPLLARHRTSFQRSLDARRSYHPRQTFEVEGNPDCETASRRIARRGITIAPGARVPLVAPRFASCETPTSVPPR